MKRAEVCQIGRFWTVDLYHPNVARESGLPIALRDTGERTAGSPFRTHAEALANALEEVGLSVPPEHREQP